MAQRKVQAKRPIEFYDHRDLGRLNNQPVGHVHRPKRSRYAGRMCIRIRPPPRPASPVGWHGRTHLVRGARPSRCTSTSASTRAPSSRPRCKRSTATAAPCRAARSDTAVGEPARPRHHRLLRAPSRQDQSPHIRRQPAGDVQPAAKASAWRARSSRSTSTPTTASASVSQQPALSSSGSTSGIVGTRTAPL